ncbi:hypothetical protein D3C73_1232670 [compost metagenome]
MTGLAVGEDRTEIEACKLAAVVKIHRERFALGYGSELGRRRPGLGRHDRTRDPTPTAVPGQRLPGLIGVVAAVLVADAQPEAAHVVDIEHQLGSRGEKFAAAAVLIQENVADEAVVLQGRHR